MVVRFDDASDSSCHSTKIVLARQRVAVQLCDSPASPLFGLPQLLQDHLWTTAESRLSPDQLLSQNTKLSDNLSKLLPTGVTAQQACNSFKNLGQCVAAIHVSHNLGLDFNALKCDITGKADTPTATCPTNTSSKMLLSFASSLRDGSFLRSSTPPHRGQFHLSDDSVHQDFGVFAHPWRILGRRILSAESPTTA
jgi:hypothetical protein